MSFLAVISALCGWVYTIAWSLSFYPQPILNARRKSTAGTTVDFPFINTLGFFAYLLSTAALRFSSTVRAEYAARHHGLEPTAATNDVVFAGHAFAVCVVIVSQYLFPRLWWGSVDANGERRVLRRPSSWILGLAVGSVVVLLVLAVVVLASSSSSSSDPNGGEGSSGFSWAWLDVVYALGYVKLVITVVKYSPQVVENYRNQSTRGWSIWTILLDFTGGVLSIVQLVIDSYRQHDWSGVTGNPVKLGLGNVSIAYDLVFLVQHYVLYRHAEDDEDKVPADAEARGGGSATERDPLLA